jgi:hypothetical protein
MPELWRQTHDRLLAVVRQRVLGHLRRHGWFDDTPDATDPVADEAPVLAAPASEQGALGVRFQDPQGKVIDAAITEHEACARPRKRTLRSQPCSGKPAVADPAQWAQSPSAERRWGVSGRVGPNALRCAAIAVRLLLVAAVD